MADISNEKALLSIASVGADMRTRIVNLLSAVNNGIYAMSLSAYDALDAFKNNEKVVIVTMLKQMQTVGAYAFQNCSILTDMEFDNVKKVFTAAFMGCVNLTSLSLPSVQFISTAAFSGCTNLSQLTLCPVDHMDTYTPSFISLVSDPFTGTPFANGSGSIYLPEALRSSYQTGRIWSNYYSRMVFVM